MGFELPRIGLPWGQDVELPKDKNNDFNARGGDDTVHGGDMRDSISGGSGDDVVYGNGGTDNLYGGDGKDKMYGGAGNDWFNGRGDEEDEYYGGKGDDYFIVDTADLDDGVIDGGEGYDEIYLYPSESDGYTVDNSDPNNPKLIGPDGKVRDNIKNIEKIIFSSS